MSGSFPAQSSSATSRPDSQTEGPLEQVNLDLRGVLDSLFAFVGVLTLDGTLIAANRAPLEAAGITFEDVVGRKFWDCYWWDYDPQVQAQLRDACERAARGEMSRYDVPVRMAGGALMMIDFMLSPMRDDNGNIIYLIPSAVDISQRTFADEGRERLLVREQEARQRAERTADRMARLQAVTSALSQALTPAQVAGVVVGEAMTALDAVGGVMLRLTDDGQVLEVEEAVGYGPEVLAQWPRLEMDRPFPLTDAVRTRSVVIIEDLEALLARYPRLAAGDHLGNSWISVPLLADDHVLGVMGMSFATARSFDDDDQRFLIALGQQSAQALERARLYEAERAARLAAEAAQQRLRVLAETSTLMATALDYKARLQQTARIVVPRMADWCGVDILREDGSLERVALAHADPTMEAMVWDMWNRYPENAMARIGALRVTATGESILVESIPDETLAPNDDPFLREMAERLTPRSYIIVPLAARGQVFGTLVMVYGPSGRRYTRDDLSVAETIGRRAAMAIENARLYEQAQAAVRVRDEFLSVASHELKTPLTSMLIHIQMLLRYAREDRLASLPLERVARMLETNERQVKRLASLIADLLDASQIGSGRLELSREETDLTEVVASVVERYAGEAADHGSEIRVDARSVVVGNWDEHRLDQVVTNLLTNAIKYGAGKPIDISIDADADCALLTVEDRGIGIAPDQLPRIFDRFERAVTARTYGGIGLGLYITRQIVEAHGGRIEVASAVDQGSTFTVILPLDALHAQGGC
ncbi:MAG: ATP-binding protein [Anaerolineae bacterium]